MALAQTTLEFAPPAPADINFIRAKVQAAGSSFYWAMRFLPARKRAALFAIYAFCREVDDIADGALGREDKIVAPLPGTVVALLAEEGATLEKGAPILTLEVMKMEQTLRAPFAGVLKAIRCKVGDIVQEGVELAEVEPIGE